MPYDGFIEQKIKEISLEDTSGYYRPLKAMESAIDGMHYKPLIYWIIGTILIWSIAIKHFVSLRKSIELSRSRTNNRLAKERQDRV